MFVLSQFLLHIKFAVYLISEEMIPLLPLPIQPESGTRSSHIHCVSWKQHQWRKSDYCSSVKCSADTEGRTTLSHYNCTALIPQQPPAFSLLQDERLKSSSLRQKIFHSTQRSTTLGICVWLITCSDHFWVLGVWKPWCSFGVIAGGEDEAMD